MKQLMISVCAGFVSTAFAAISDPQPDVTPASEISWEDFGGATRATSGNWDAKDQTYSYSNGAFNMNNTSWQKGLTLNIGAGMTFTANGSWNGPIGGVRELHVIRIFKGGTFVVKGDWTPNYTHLQVDNGGVFQFNPKSFKSNQSKQSWFDVYGTLDAPAGLKASGDLRMDIITHEGSTIRLGGDVSKNGNAGATLRWLVKGGRIEAVEDVRLDCAELEISADAAVTLDVAENKVFDFSPFTTIGAGAQITKTGLGSVAIQSGAPVAVREGAVLLPITGAYDLAATTFSADAILKLGAEGLSVTAYDDSLLTVKKIVLDSALVADGAVAVIAPDEAFATWAVAAINASIQEGFAASANGLNVEIHTALVAKTATWTGRGIGSNWNDEGNWDGGKPATGGGIAFGDSAKTDTTDDIPGLTVSSVKFTPEAGAYTLGGTETLTVLDSVINQSAATQTFQMPVAPSGQSVAIEATGDIAFNMIASSGTSLEKTGAGTVLFNKGFAGKLSIREGGVAVPSTATLSSNSGAVTINGTLDLGGGTLAIVQADSDVPSIGDGAVLKNGTFNHSSEKPVYVTNARTGRAFMWPSGTWTIGAGATVVTSGYLFEFGPDAPAETYGERRIVIDGGELRSTADGCKYVIGVDNDFSKPAVIELKNGGLLKTTAANEFHIGARNSGTGSSMKARGMVVANDSTIELSDQLRILNEKNESNSSGILAMTNSVLKLTNTGKTHELNATGKPWTEAEMILNNTTASFGQLQARARVGGGMADGRMVGQLTVDGATLKPIKATDKFIYNDEAATAAIAVLAGGVTVDTDYNVTIPAIATGVGGLVKKGAGTLTLSAANAYTGATVVEEGALCLTGAVAGSLSVSAGGTLKIALSEGSPVVGSASSVAFAEGASVVLDASGAPESSSYPFLLVSGEVTGLPQVLVTGTTKRWKLRVKETSEGSLCEAVPQRGFVIDFR